MLKEGKFHHHELNSRGVIKPAPAELNAQAQSWKVVERREIHGKGGSGRPPALVCKVTENSQSKTLNKDDRPKWEVWITKGELIIDSPQHAEFGILPVVTPGLSVYRGKVGGSVLDT